MEYTVQLNWDDDACVWTATSDDIPGLVLESGSLDALIERVRYAAAELIELDGLRSADALLFRLERRERMFA